MLVWLPKALPERTARYRDRGYRSRLIALIITMAVHFIIAGLLIADWRPTPRLIRENSPIVVTLLPQEPDKPAQRRSNGVTVEKPSPKPASPEAVVPSVNLLPERNVQQPAAIIEPPTMPDGGVNDAAAQVIQAYRSVVRARLEMQRRYPVGSLLNGYEGSGLVVFRIDRTGRLIGLGIETSTGHDALDREALAVVRRAAPFPPIPAELPDELEIGFPIAFLIVEPESTMAGR